MVVASGKKIFVLNFHCTSAVIVRGHILMGLRRNKGQIDD